MNASLYSAFVPEAIYPMTENVQVSTSLVDANAQVQFKPHAFFSDNDDPFFMPYIGGGFGVNSASNNARMYVPASAGMRFRISRHFSIQLESSYKFGLGSDNFQHVAHSAGFVFALPSERPPKKKDEKDKKPPTGPTLADGQLDSDGDMVPDREDMCPDVKGYDMYLGCPDAKQAGIAEDPAEKDDEALVTLPKQKEDPKITPLTPTPINPKPGSSSPPTEIEKADQEVLRLAMNRIHFAPASDQLLPQSYGTLDTVAMIMRKYPNHKLEVLGHTDNTGSPRDNLVLSIKRAHRVKYYLAHEKEIILARISSNGYGEKMPVASNESETGRKLNRRVEFKLLPMSPEELPAVYRREEEESKD
jgi:outer membrane protein OmpA-like peptidoglycan-associated protein